jgi:hypothetical protein
MKYSYFIDTGRHYHRYDLIKNKSLCIIFNYDYGLINFSYNRRIIKYNKLTEALSKLSTIIHQ